MPTVERFIKTFVDLKRRSVADLAEEANRLAKEKKLLIVSAQLVFSGAGRTFEEPVLLVVYERVKAQRKQKDKAEEIGE